ncbi:MAG: hypothetical protein LBV33_07715 [Lachnospiraceae bacterium]|jgi:hypothetical protein|nr:hypothetical protein [Lachnospiraceae bacterium]
MDKEELIQMSKRDICAIDQHELVEVEAVFIDEKVESIDRIGQYIEQVHNPYCFLAGDRPVQIRFRDGAPPLSQALYEYFAYLKQR